MFNFEKLEVWQKAIAYAGSVYEATRRFPDTERFGLISQMRRAASSIGSNIAEGSSRSSKADYIRFIEYATGSVFEVVTQSFVARNEQWLAENDFARLYADAEELSRMLSGLRRSLGD